MRTPLLPRLRFSTHIRHLLYLRRLISAFDATHSLTERGSSIHGAPPLLRSLVFFLSSPPPPTQKKAALLLARSTTTARLSSPATPPATATATIKKREAAEKERRRCCPDALLVRAVEALGRVYMHREAALVDDSGSGGGAASAATAAGGGGAGEEEEEQLQQQQAEEMSMLQPMPFSVKMRELVVWATNTVLPVLVGDGGGVGSSIDMAEAGGGTPGELGVHPVTDIIYLVICHILGGWF